MSIFLIFKENLIPSEWKLLNFARQKKKINKIQGRAFVKRKFEIFSILTAI